MSKTLKLVKMKSKSILYTISCLLILGSCLACDKDPMGLSQDPLGPQAGQNPPEEEDPSEQDGKTMVYQEGTNGYEVYRIPAIVKTEAGTLLAFAEARKLKSNGDSGDIDMVVKSSDDDGKTWSEMRIIWDEGGNTCGNPVPIVDTVTGKIHLLMTWNHADDTWGSLSSETGVDTRRVYYTSSDDNGESWTAPTEITASVKDPSWGWFGTGPVHGIQLQKGEHQGRLVSPNYYTVKEGGSVKTYSNVSYSDDNGVTWQSGSSVPGAGAGECTVAELEDGTLLMNIRNGNELARKVSKSEDGGVSWSTPEISYVLTDPHCQGSMVSSDTSPYRVFFANAASTERINMTIKMSEDGGASWGSQKLIHSGPSAYSDLVMLSDDAIGILYEGGEGRPYENIVFENVEVSDLK